MPAEEIEDTEVAFAGKTARTGNAALARGMVHEAVDPSTGDVKIISGKAAEQDEIREGGASARTRFKPSTEALLAKLEEPDTGDDEDDGEVDTDDVGLVEGVEAKPAEGATSNDGTEGTDEQPKDEEIVNEWQQKYQQAETANQRLLAELEAAKKTPAHDRSDYEQTLVDAYKAYVDEGPVVAIRKFLGAVLGVAPDSKEVSTELSGAYIDLTAQEVGVPLDQAQQATREAQRARLALARDKRERAESEKKAATPGNSAEEQQVANGARYIDSILNVKSQGGSSIAEEYPLLVAMAEDLDGYKPGELIARAIKREIKIGALAADATEAQMIKHTASKIEKHYKQVKERLIKAAPQQIQTDTTKQGNAAAKSASKDTRQGTGAQTINNAKASVAPATPPKTKQTTKAVEQKTRKDFRSNREWQDYLFSKNGF